MSLSWPGVSKKVINLPVPSQRTCILVVNPPRLRPKASASALLFLLQQHVGEHELWWSRWNGLPNPHCSQRPRQSATRQTSCPRCLPCASVESGYRSLSTSHIVLAYLATVHPCAAPKSCHSGVVDGLALVVHVLFLISGATVLCAPIVHWLGRHGFPCRPV